MPGSVLLRKGRDQLLTDALRRLQLVGGVFKQGHEQWIVSPGWGSRSKDSFRNVTGCPVVTSQ